MNAEQVQKVEEIQERQALNLPAVDRLDSELAQAVWDIEFLLALNRTLASEVEALERGEFICKRCYRRKDAEFALGDF